MSQPQAKASSKIELDEVKAQSAIPAYLAKPVLDTFEDVQRFKGWYRMPSNKERRPCVVTRDLFELITEGDVTFPVIQVGDNKPIAVPIIDESRAKEAMAILHSTQTTNVVII